MEKSRSITTLLLDIDGVLLTDGWDHQPANGWRRNSIWIWPVAV